MALTRLGNSAITEASVTQHVTATDLQPIKSDLSALALREATNEASAAFNLPNQFIETFTDDTNLGTQTNCDRVSGAMMTVVEVSGAYSSDSNTIALFHFDNNITDSSSNAYSFTNNGSTGFSTSYKKFGTHALSMDGSDDDISGTISGIGTGNFTIDWWSNTNGTRTTGQAERHFGLDMDGTVASGNNPELDFGYPGSTNANKINIHGDLQSPADWTLTSVHATSTTFDSNAWVHNAVQRSSTTLYYFCDGIREGTNSCNANNVDGTFTIGARSGGGDGERFTGYIDEFRISDNARYSTSGSNGDTIFTPQANSTTTSATGTLIQSANTVGSNKTKVGGTMLYKDNEGTATLGTDLIIYFTCDGGSNWTEAASYNAVTPVYSTGIKQVRLGETTCTSGTDVRYKAVYANQATGSKEFQLHGIGINY